MFHNRARLLLLAVDAGHVVPGSDVNFRDVAILTHVIVFGLFFIASEGWSLRRILGGTLSGAPTQSIPGAALPRIL